jgi:hypothetical protein
MWADTAYRGLKDWLQDALGWRLSIPQHWWTGYAVWMKAGSELPPRPSGFQVLARRWVMEVVFTQLTKADVLTRKAGRQHVADFDLIIRDDDTINQQQRKLPALLEGGIRQPVLHPLAKGLQGGCHAGKLLLALCIVMQKPLLTSQRLHALLQVAAAPFILVER